MVRIKLDTSFESALEGFVYFLFYQINMHLLSTCCIFITERVLERKIKDSDCPGGSHSPAVKTDPGMGIRNFMCQLGWAMEPRYLVKHYSGCFCDGVFWMRLILKSVDFE